jgi:beta-lactamase regulating signal transducer with metallopeptidase domain/regulation of enolase protein 1 (concanavalin A-like superfamily)
MIQLLNNIAQIWWGWMWPMLWQVSLLIALIGGVDVLVRKHVWPQVRYAVWLLVLVKLILPPTFSLSTSVVSQLHPVVQQLFRGHAAVRAVEDIPSPVVYLMETNFLVNPLVAQPVHLNDLGHADIGGTADSAVQSEPTESGLQFGAQIDFSPQVYAMTGWLVGVILFLVWLTVRFRQLRRAHCRDAETADFPLWFTGTLADVASKLKLRRLPKIVRSRCVACPAVFGVFRPVLLVPAAEMKRFSRKETEHILLHELAHIKRGDLRVHALGALLQIVYWFNPLLRLVQRRLQNLRELCCDATVASVLQDRTPDYRQTILETAKWLLAKPRMPGLGFVGLVENRNRLLVRLKWLEKKPWKHRSLRIVTCFLVVALMFVGVLPMAEARQAALGEPPRSSGVKTEAEPELLDAADARRNDNEPRAVPSGSAEVPPGTQILFDCKLYYVPANVGIVEGNQQAIGQKNPFVVLEGSQHADRLKALSREYPHVYLAASPQILAKSGREALIQMTDEAGSSRELKLVGEAKYGGQVISITVDFEHEGRMSMRGQLSTRNDEPLIFGWRITDNTEEILVITPHLVSAEGEQVAPVPIKREDSQTSSGYINAGDFDGQAKQLREMLEGGISSILTGLRDDKGRLVTVIYFKGAEDSPLVLHLAEQNGGWLIDYFYVGSSDIENQDPIRSRKKLPREGYVRFIRDETNQKKPGHLVDENPLSAVGRQIRHLRTILEGQDTGLNIVCGAGEPIQVITELARGPQREVGYIIHHLIQENGKYRIECMESADDVKLQPEPRPGMSDVGVPEPTTRPPDILALDDFDGKLSLDWDILHPDPSHYSLTKKLGTLTITTQDGHFKEAHRGYKNLFLIDTPVPPGQDFQITTCLSDFRPLEAYNQAGLICWDDEDNYLEWIYQKMESRGLTFSAGMESNGHTQYAYVPAGGPYQKLWLRITKQGDSYECSSSTDGKSFTVDTVQRWGDGSPKRVGLFAINGSLTHPPEVDASFDFFEVRLVSARQAVVAVAAQTVRAGRPEVAVEIQTIPAGPQQQEPMIIGEGNAKKGLSGQYLHRSRGNDYMRAKFTKSILKDGTVLYTLAAQNTQYRLTVDAQGRPRQYKYESASERFSCEFEFSKGAILHKRQTSQKGPEEFKWTVSKEALPDFNSRPDPYLIQHVLVRAYDFEKAGKQTFTVYDIDNQGTGINEYQITLEIVDEDGVTLPNGKFKAKHLVQVQQTDSGTWYKKGPGSKTEYWVDDEGLILRVYRHREPYEVILTDYKQPPQAAAGQEPVPLRSAQPEVQLSRLVSRSRVPLRVASNLPDGTGGHALQFDGIDDFVTIPPDRSLDIRGSLTVSAWVKHAGDRHGVIIWRGDGAEARDPYALEASGQRMYFRMDVGERCYVASRTTLDDQWHFWTAVCDKEAGKLYLYKDGSLESSTDGEVKFPYDTSRMWNMFGAVVLGQHTSEHFKGTIDEVRIWNIARSRDQIKEYMNRSLTGTEPGLVGYWKFDQDEGEIIRNRTVHLNNGVAGQLPWDI